MNAFWNDHAVVSKLPIASALLFEYANVGQLYRMWTEHTAAGQSLFAWWAVGLGLLLYANFYRVVTPLERWAIRVTLLSFGMNCLVSGSVLYFRLTGRG